MCVSLASPRYHLHVLGYPRCDDERQATAEPYSLQLRRAPIFSANTRRLRVLYVAAVFYEYDCTCVRL